MAATIKKKGYLSVDELKSHGCMPDESRFQQGPVAVLECIQEIPCNPCVDACHYGAIYIGECITDLPQLDTGKCIGCGACIAHCSGLAIFVVDKTYSETTAAVSFPHEYLPLPEKGRIVQGVNRKGEVVCDGKVIRINNAKANDHTPIITLEIPKELADEVRGMKRLPNEPDKHEEPHICQCINGNKEADSDSVIVCRCEEVTAGEIKKAIEQGAETLTGIKRRTRAGMGLCQGRTCSRIVSQMLAQAKNKPVSEIEPDRSRPPVKPVEFGIYGGVDNE